MHGLRVNGDPASLNRYLRLIRSAERQDTVLLATTAEEDGFILAGAHAGDAWCWCQPVVIDLPCQGGKHLSHPQVNHRRTMDSVVLDDDNPRGFTVDSRGASYPNGQVCVGPADRPE